MFGGELLIGGFVTIALVGFGGIVALMIWLGIRAQRRERERRAALAARVTSKGYGYTAELNERAQLFTSAPFKLGNNRRARDVVWGSIGGQAFETFAYQYETQHTDSDGHTTTETHKYQVTWVALPAGLPTMRFTADNGFLRFFAKMGAKDLDVESKEFNDRWKVWCADERIGHAILTPALIAFMLAPGWVGRGVVIEGQLLMTYTSGHTELQDLEGVVGGLFGFRDYIPEFLFAEDGLK